MQLYCNLCPVYTMYGGSSSPLALQQTCTVIFSRPEPGMSACGDFVPLFTNTLRARPLSGKPTLSTLKILQGDSCRFRVSRVGFRHSMNQWFTSSGFEHCALTSCNCCGFLLTKAGWQCKKPAHQSSPGTPFLKGFFRFDCWQNSATTDLIQCIFFAQTKTPLSEYLASLYYFNLFLFS